MPDGFFLFFIKNDARPPDMVKEFRVVYLMQQGNVYLVILTWYRMVPPGHTYPHSESRYQKIQRRDNLVALVLQGADLFPQIMHRHTGQFRR